MKYVFIPASATRDGREYGGFATDEQAAALQEVSPEIVVVGDPGDE